MLSTIEFAIAAIALAWLILMVAIGVFYVKIGREQCEIRRIKEKVDHTEASIKEISRFFVALKTKTSAC